MPLVGVRGTKALHDLSLVPFLSWGCAECPSWLCSSPPKLSDPSAVPSWGPQVLRLQAPRGSPPALVSEVIPDLSLWAPFSSSSHSRPCLSQPDPVLTPLSLGREARPCPVSPRLSFGKPSSRHALPAWTRPPLLLPGAEAQQKGLCWVCWAREGVFQAVWGGSFRLWLWSFGCGVPPPSFT